MDSGLSRQTRRSEAPRQAVASAIAWPGAAWLRTRSDGRGPRFGAHTPGGGESAGGRSEGCGREKRSRTSRDGLDETPDRTQRQKHRGQTDRSLRLAARRPRRSDKGQAKTVGVTHSSGNGCARLVNTERDVRRGSSDRETPCGHPAAPSAAPPPRPGGFCRGQASPPPRWCPAEHARPLCDRAGSRPKHDRSTVTCLSRDRT